MLDYPTIWTLVSEKVNNCRVITVARDWSAVSDYSMTTISDSPMVMHKVCAPPNGSFRIGAIYVPWPTKMGVWELKEHVYEFRFSSRSFRHQSA